MKRITAVCLILLCCAAPFSVSAESDVNDLTPVDKLVNEISSKTH